MEQLDRQIIDWIAANATDEAVASQLRAASVRKRDYMRTGYFVYLDVPDDTPPIEGKINVVCPDIASSELLDGAGTELFLRDGRLHYLEIYARGGFFPPDLTEFRLLQPDE